MSTELAARERLLRRVLAALLVLGIVAVCVMAVQNHRAAETERAATAATKAARTGVPAILNYTDATLDTQLAASRRLMTPEYAKQFSTMVKAKVWPQARKFAVANQVGVVSIGIVRVTPDTAVVLVFANQTTRTKAKPEGITQGTRLELTLEHHDGRWLINGMRPL